MDSRVVCALLERGSKGTMVGPGAPFDGTGEELTIESVLDPLPVNDRPAIRVRIVLK